MRRVLLATLLLAACVPAPGATPFATVRPQPIPGATPPPARGETRLDVVAVSHDAEGRETELTGAACEARSPYFAADFTAPARLLIPDFGPNSPQVDVTCRSGSAVGRASSRPDWAWSGGFGGWPAIGVSVGTGTQSGVGVGFGWYGGGTGMAAGQPAIRYPALRVAVE